MSDLRAWLDGNPPERSLPSEWFRILSQIQPPHSSSVLCPDICGSLTALPALLLSLYSLPPKAARRILFTCERIPALPRFLPTYHKSMSSNPFPGPAPPGGCLPFHPPSCRCELPGAGTQLRDDMDRQARWGALGVTVVIIPQAVGSMGGCAGREGMRSDRHEPSREGPEGARKQKGDQCGDACLDLTLMLLNSFFHG